MLEHLVETNSGDFKNTEKQILNGEMSHDWSLVTVGKGRVINKMEYLH